MRCGEFFLCFSPTGLETNVSVSVLIPYLLKYDRICLLLFLSMHFVHMCVCPRMCAREREREGGGDLDTGDTFIQVHGFISLQITLCQIQ